MFAAIIGLNAEVAVLKQLFSKLFQRKPVPSGIPANAVYLIPTMYDPLPAIETPQQGARYALLHEDSWRQVEFVASQNLEYIQRELSDLTTLKEARRKGVGYTNVATRHEHPVPLRDVNLAFSALPAFNMMRVGIGGKSLWSGSIVGGFAIVDESGWFVYGQRDDAGMILQLGLCQARKVPSTAFLTAICELALSKHLLLVDWVATSLIDASSPQSIMNWAQTNLRDELPPRHPSQSP